MTFCHRYSQEQMKIEKQQEVIKGMDAARALIEMSGQKDISCL